MAINITVQDVALIDALVPSQTRWRESGTEPPPNPTVGDTFYNEMIGAVQIFDGTDWCIGEVASRLSEAVFPPRWNEPHEHRCEWCGRLHLELYETCPGCGGPR